MLTKESIEQTVNSWAIKPCLFQKISREERQEDVLSSGKVIHFYDWYTWYKFHILNLNRTMRKKQHLCIHPSFYQVLQIIIFILILHLLSLLHLTFIWSRSLHVHAPYSNSNKKCTFWLLALSSTSYVICVSFILIWSFWLLPHAFLWFYFSRMLFSRLKSKYTIDLTRPGF